ncbi:MAG: carotenoid oxygenase family protein, partial [Myxococcota bacterium]
MPIAHDAVFQGQPDEHAFRVTRVEGTLPPDLAGTVLRSGPGRMELGGDCLNFFDGHALLAGVTFDGGAATFRSRFVRTPLNEREAAQKAVLQRRIFTNHPSRWSNLFALALGNSGLHDVYAWGDGDALRVCAGSDPGHFALDPRTLATRGGENWSGFVAPGQEMGPMPYRDPHSGNLVGWVKQPGGLKPDQLRFVEIDGSFRVVKATPFLPLGSSPAIVHDQRATARWYVTVEAAARLSPAKAIWGARTVYEAFAVPPGATATLLLVPRDGDGPTVRIPLPAPIEVAFHVINAWDDGDSVVVDLTTYDGRVRFEAAVPPAHRDRLGVTMTHGPLPTPMRFRVDPRAARVIEARPIGTLPGEAPEVPDHVMGRPYRYAYVPPL